MSLQHTEQEPAKDLLVQLIRPTNLLLEKCMSEESLLGESFGLQRGIQDVKSCRKGTC